MPAIPAAAQGIVRSKLLPGVPSFTDNTPQDERLGSHGERYGLSLFNGLQAAAVERSYYTATFQPSDSTRASGVAITPVTGTSYAATQALLIVENTNPAGGPDVIMDTLTIKIDTVPGAGTFWYVYPAVDGIMRYSTGGLKMIPYNCDGNTAQGVLIYGGNPTALAAGGNCRDIGTGLITNGVSVANAALILKFGRLEGQGSGTFTTPTTGVAQSTFDFPPVVIPPGSSFVLNEFQTSRGTSATIGELFVGLIVR